MKKDVLAMRQIVDEVMSNHPETRNSDKLLTFKVLERLGLITDTGHGYYFTKSKISEMPSFQSIRLVRQIIQNQEKRLLPTDPEVMRLRRIYDAEMKDIHKWYDDDEENPDDLINNFDRDDRQRRFRVK